MIRSNDTPKPVEVRAVRQGLPSERAMARGDVDAEKFPGKIKKRAAAITAFAKQVRIEDQGPVWKC